MEPEGFRIHKRPPPVPLPSHINPIHASPSHFLKILFNTTIPSASRSSKWSLCLRSPHQNPICTSPVSHTCYVPRQSHSSGFDSPNNIRWAVLITNSPVYSLLRSPVTSFLLWPIYFSTPYSRNTLSLCSSLSETDMFWVVLCDRGTSKGTSVTICVVLWHWFWLCKFVCVTNGCLRNMRQ